MWSVIAVMWIDCVNCTEVSLAAVVTTKQPNYDRRYRLYSLNSEDTLLCVNKQKAAHARACLRLVHILMEESFSSKVHKNAGFCI